MAVNLKDKYYTPDWLVEHVIKKTIEIIGIENIREVVESSGGDGAFIGPLKRSFNGVTYRFYDLHPEHPEIIEQDYKTVRLSYKRGRLTIGNPPFGKSSSLWKAFCKKAATNSDYISFISPASQYNSNYYFKEGVLVYSELLNNVVYRGSEKEGGKDQAVRTCLNIYKVYDREEEEDWREIQLSKDLFIGPRDDIKNEYDFYVGRMYSYKLVNKNILNYGVKVLNKDIKERVGDILKGYDDYIKINERGYILRGSIPGLKEYLMRHLYPTREERLEQDVQFLPHTAHGTKGEYYITQMGDAGHISKELRNAAAFPVNIKNEDIRQKFEDSFDKIKELLKKHPALQIATGGSESICLPAIKEVLMRHLYPTREERLEQDILIDRSNKFDYCVGRRGNGYYGKLLKENNGDNFSITILNESIRENLSYILTNLRTNSINKLKEIEGTPTITLPVLKEYLIQHLYPTREERLEQDVIMTEVRLPSLKTGISRNLDFDADFYIGNWGAGPIGKISKTPFCQNQLGVKILNDNRRKEIEKFFYSYKEKYILTGLQDEHNIGGVWLNRTFLKKELMNVLYPQSDPDFSDYEYSEIKKPVHVERAIYAKELF